jgi:hypothetical protein
MLATYILIAAQGINRHVVLSCYAARLDVGEYIAGLNQ